MMSTRKRQSILSITVQAGGLGGFVLPIYGRKVFSRGQRNAIATTASAALITLALMSPPARAGAIDDVFNAAGASYNATTGQVVRTQHFSGYAGGSLTWRIPRKDLQLIHISPPSFSAGCNGIDFFTGAFSFPNSEQFVQALRNFGQQALGALFMSALKWISPVIASTVEFIMELARQVNSFNIDGCKFGMNLGNKMNKWIEEATGYDSSVGIGKDYADSLNKMREELPKVFSSLNKAIYGEDNASVPAAKVDGSRPLPYAYNVTWRALRKMDKNNALTQDTKEIMMSLIGTVVYTPKNDKDGKPSALVEALPHSLSFDQIWGTDTEAAKVIRCHALNHGGQTYEKDTHCINVVETAAGIEAFLPRYLRLYDKLVSAVTARSLPTLDATEQMLLRLSSTPLWRVAAMDGTPGMPAAIAHSIKMPIIYYSSFDTARGVVLYLLGDLEKALDAPDLQSDAADTELLLRVAELKDRIKIVKENIRTTSIEYHNDFPNLLGNIDMIVHAERAWQSGLSVQFAANWAFNGGIR